MLPETYVLGYINIYRRNLIRRDIVLFPYDTSFLKNGAYESKRGHHQVQVTRCKFSYYFVRGMEILVYNFHSVLTDSLICRSTPSPKFRLRQVRCVSPSQIHTSTSRTSLRRMAQLAQNPGNKICHFCFSDCFFAIFSDLNLVEFDCDSSTLSICSSL